MAEIRALRAQLEQIIQVNNGLRLQLEQQLDRGTGKATLSPSSVGQIVSADVEPAHTQPLFQGTKERGAEAPARGDVCGTRDSPTRGDVYGTRDSPAELLCPLRRRQDMFSHGLMSDNPGFRIRPASTFQVCYFEVIHLGQNI